jgi:Na+/alanine symporter
VREGIEYNAVHYPYYAYGTDWLAFAHIIIAVSFIGPFRDPVRNIRVIHYAMIACVFILPLAMICGEIRSIPFAWRLVDCCFGVFGIIPLIAIHKMTKALERETGYIQNCVDKSAVSG